MKKTITFIGTFFLIISSLLIGSFYASADAKIFTEGNYQYTVENNEATIYDVVDSITDGNIPSTLDGYPVTSIGNSAFSGCTGLTTITIPDSVITIGSYAFHGCAGLTSITISENVTSIGDWAFFNCSSLTSITIPDSVTFIGEYAFHLCERLASIDISDSITTIERWAFSYCFSLTSITIPDSIISIETNAFQNCTRLTSVTIGAGVSALSTNAFEGCHALDSISVVERNNTYTSIEGVLFNKDKTIIVYFPDGKTGAYTIPDSVTDIGESAFQDCNGLTSINIPDSVTSIGNYAFNDCTGLTNVNIGNKVTTIGEYAFYDCTNLNSVHISDLAKWCSIDFGSIDANPLYYANALYLNDSLITDLVIPNNVITITPYAFYGCSHLTSITIPDSATSIGEDAFYGCTGLQEMTLPFVGNTLNGTKNTHFGYIFGTSSYSDNDDYVPSSLKKVTITKATTIGDWAFYGCAGLTSITIPESVTSIGYAAFGDCTGLTSITIPDGVTSIGSFAFGDCTGLTSITIPDSVITIGSYAFDVCTSLTSITIPDSVTTIDSGAFRYCSGLTSVYITDLAKWCSIDFGSMYANPLYYADALYLNDTLIIDLVIPDSITSISKYAFNGYFGLISVTIPDSIISIGKSAFYYCMCLTDVWYTGTIAQRNKITFGSDNSRLTSATWHYDSCPIGAPHTYDHDCDTDCNVCKEKRSVGPHIYDNACDTSCNECQAEREVGPHQYDDVCDSLCNECQAERIPPHIYDNICDTNCNLCQEKREVPKHDYADGFICIHCNAITPINAPTLKSKTNLRIELNAIPFAEYSMDGEHWQESAVFENLESDTEYTLYQRYPATNITEAGPTSEPLTVKTEYSLPAPNAPIIIQYTDIAVSLYPNAAFEFSLDGVHWQESNLFYDLEPGTEYTFYQRYKATTEVPFPSKSSTGTKITTDRSIQNAVPPAPIAQSITATTTTLVAVDGCEYSINGTSWKSSPIFSNLSVGTEYTFYQRYAATETTYAGQSSSAKIKTDKGTQTAPAAPTLQSKTYNQIILVARNGYEYSINGVDWQSNPIFSGLSAATNYFVYQRKAETDRYYTSPMSVSLLVRTDDKPSWYIDVTGVTLNKVTLDLGIGDSATLQATITPADATNQELIWRSSDPSIASVDAFGNITAHTLGTVQITVCTVENRFVATCTLTVSHTHQYTDNCDATCDTCQAERIPYDHIYTNNCDVDCNVCGGIRIPYDHIYTNACDTTCNICGTSRSVDPHQYTNSCDIDCNICGARRGITHTYSNACDTQCNICGTSRTVGAHIYDADCDDACNECGTKRTPAAHRYTNNCDAYCDGCNDKRTPPHTFENDCDTSCNVCGAIRSVGAHQYTNSCDTTCNECGASRTIQHTYDGACDAYCNICGTKRSVSHSYSNACDDVCNLCNTKRTVEPHRYSNGCDDSCNECGKKRVVGAHNYSNSCDGSCNECGATRNISHSFKAYVYNEDATTSTDGTKTRTCSVCKKTETVTAAGTKLQNPFNDVKLSQYYAEPVLWAVSKGITNGTSATTFSPDDNCTRSQIVTFMWRAAGSPEPTSTRNPFKDVKSNQYYYKAVLWAVEKGITNGTSATTFSPDATCTRAQVVTFLWRAKGAPKVSAANPFKDVKKSYYSDAVLWAVKNNITTGTSATTFSPDATCTRGQIVTFLFRAYKD